MMTTLRRALPASAVFLALLGCRGVADGNARVKDIELSPSDIGKGSLVLWLTANDSMVHGGSCPVNTAKADRNCQGMKEAAQPVSLDVFKANLTKAIAAARPGNNGVAIQPDEDLAKSLEAKIKRLEGKLQAGNLSQTETQNFQQQLAQLKKELAAARFEFTAAEKKDFDAIVTSLQAGQDVTLDEGEARFALAQAAFGGSGYKSYRMVLLAGVNSGCSSTSTVSDFQLRIGGQYHAFTAGTQNNLSLATTIAGEAATLIVSSNYSGNPVTGLLSPNSNTSWAPTSYLDSSGKATSLQFVQIDFTKNTAVTGVSFRDHTSSAGCTVSEFRMDGSNDGQNWNPIPNGAFTNTHQSGNAKQFQWVN